MLVDDVALKIQPLSPHDTIARAAEAIRVSPASAVPVAEDGRIIGVVSARALKEAVAGCTGEQVRRQPIATVMNGDLLCLRSNVSVEQALELFRDNEVDAAPVLDPVGRYVGMVGTGELLSAACHSLRPSMIGGLATPLGVYLTNGVVRAGVGDAALVSAGFFMGLLQFIAAWSADLLTRPLVRLAQDGHAHAVFALLGSLLPASTAVFWLPPVLTLLFFCLLFRFSWVTGYHAAEHQVVHAIEQGDDLTAEAVRAKPRVHPRCGTNLMAAFILFMVMHGSLPPELSWLAFPTALIAWRAFGAVLQQYITTRPANDWQLRSGLHAGEQLLERYQARVTEQPSRWRRIWNIGLLQVLCGFLLLWTVLWLLQSIGFLKTAWLDYLGS
jgi:predicted transcriptional regulator